MLVSIDINDKHFGPTVLYNGLGLTLNKNEKVGLIGRNGTGKTTLFRILTGDDTDYDGEIMFARGTITIATKQEHIGLEDLTCVDYILSELPDYEKLKRVIDSLPDTVISQTKMNAYSDAVEQFSSLGYYTIEDSVLQQLAEYQITESMAKGRLNNLSGGQKRFVELVKIAHAKADLALIDEPTNHMDYIAKAAFIDWLQKIHSLCVLIITHDRDVLKEVDRIIELKDGQAYEFKGNYDAYLKQNSTSTVQAIQNYEVALATLANLKKQMEYAKARAPGYKGKSANNPWVVMLKRLQKDYSRLEATAVKPSFWIDRESVDNLHNKTAASYHKYKAKNIRIANVNGQGNGGSSSIVSVEKLSLGYDMPIFEGINFALRDGDKIRLHGRNGAGKTTLIKAILASAWQTETEVKTFTGKIDVRAKLKIGVYQQEISRKYIDMPLEEAVERMYLDRNLPISTQRIKQLLGNYLFDPITDAKIPLKTLSGGQKARFQLISMLADDPQLLILDEPTNHLDLPSIEELENALMAYKGAIIFISHDNYFVNKFPHQTIPIGG